MANADTTTASCSPLRHRCITVHGARATHGLEFRPRYEHVLPPVERLVVVTDPVRSESSKVTLPDSGRALCRGILLAIRRRRRPVRLSSIPARITRRCYKRSSPPSAHFFCEYFENHQHCWTASTRGYSERWPAVRSVWALCLPDPEVPRIQPMAIRAISTSHNKCPELRNSKFTEASLGMRYQRGLQLHATLSTQACQNGIKKHPSSMIAGLSHRFSNTTAQSRPRIHSHATALRRETPSQVL